MVEMSGVLEPDIREKFRRSGYTLTSQRRAVLDALNEAGGHPSAEDIYLIVKKKNPRVALGTVYQALSVLEEIGVIGSKHWSESPTRYDLNLEPHLDVRCAACGAVSEIPGVELGRGMEAAGALIESLEEEVANLRRDLEQASVALKAAQEEVSARGRALEERERTRAEAERNVEDVRAELGELRARYSDEQLKLRNQHISELAGQRRKLEDQRRVDVEAASSEERVATLKEEFRREREALGQRHRAEIEALRTSTEQWEEKLREAYREQEERHEAELESMLLEVEERKEEVERHLREDFERRYGAERRAADERQEASLQALRNA